jgi:hypothetical protein
MIIHDVQTVCDSVNNILNDTNMTDTVDAVVKRLVSLGYISTEEDGWMIAYCIKGTVHHVLNEINHQTVPEGLFEVVVDMVCGEFLNSKYSCGQLNLEGLDVDGMIQSVKEGDTQVNFSAEGSDEAKLKGLLSWLIQGKGCDLICYRRMRW